MGLTLQGICVACSGIRIDKEKGTFELKFEYHFYCHVFPMSQELGSHQNAHKQEMCEVKRVFRMLGTDDIGTNFEPFGQPELPFMLDQCSFAIYSWKQGKQENNKCGGGFLH